MVFLTCQTSLTHYFVPQHVLNTSLLVYKTLHNMTQCTLNISFLSCKTPTACYSDRNALWPYCLLAAKMSKGCPVLWKTSLYLTLLLATCLNMSSFPCKVPSTCSFFSCKTSSECTFLAQRAWNMLFLVCEMLHNMKILEYVSQHVVFFRQSAFNM